MKKAAPTVVVAALAALASAACAPDGPTEDAGVVDAGEGDGVVDAGDDGGAADDGPDAGGAPADCAAAGAGFSPATSSVAIVRVDAAYDGTLADACAVAERAVVVDVVLSAQDLDVDHVAWAFDADHAPRDASPIFTFGNGVRAVACAVDAERTELAVQVVFADATTTPPACATLDPP